MWIEQLDLASIAIVCIGALLGERVTRKDAVLDLGWRPREHVRCPRPSLQQSLTMDRLFGPPAVRLALTLLAGFSPKRLGLLTTSTYMWKRVVCSVCFSFSLPLLFPSFSQSLPNSLNPFISSLLPALLLLSLSLPLKLPTVSAAMTAYLSRFSPIPGFPSYTGPHKVGTLDVEFPVSDIEAPSAAPSESIPTIQYRIFYPCEPDAKGKTISWIPTPQRGYIGAYSRFLGAGTYLAEFIS